MVDTEARRSALLLILLTITTLRPWAQSENAGRRMPRVLPVVQPGTEDEDPRLQRIVLDAMSLELERAGVDVADPPVDTPEAAGDSGGTPRRLDQWLDIGAAGSLDYLLFALYSESAGRILVRCELYDVPNRALVSTATQTGRMGLTLDELVAACVGDILEDRREVFADLPERALAQPLERPEPEDTSRTERERAMQRDEPPIRRIEIAAGFAPLLVVGQASDIFKMGLSPSLGAHYWVGYPFGQLGYGLYTALSIFYPEDIESASPSYLIPLGPDLRYRIGVTDSLSLFARLSAGPSLLVLNFGAVSGGSKILVYALAGIGLDLALSEAIGILLDSSYLVFFETEAPIMGYSPGLYLSLRL